MRTLTFTEHDLAPTDTDAVVTDGTPFVHLPETATLKVGHSVTIRAPGASPVAVLSKSDKRVATVPAFSAGVFTLVQNVEPIIWQYRLGAVALSAEPITGPDDQPLTVTDQDGNDVVVTV